MASPGRLSHWGGRGLYLLAACLILFVRLLPLDFTPGGLARADLMLAITFAWVMRRPEQVPPLMIAAVFLVFDLLFLKAPGLWPLIVLLAAEFLRSRSPGHDLPFLTEWLLVAVVALAAVLAESLVLSVFAVAKAPIGVALLGMLATLLAYPLVVALLRYGLGLRRAAPGEADAMGGRS